MFKSLEFSFLRGTFNISTLISFSMKTGKLRIPSLTIRFLIIKEEGVCHILLSAERLKFQNQLLHIQYAE